MSRWLYGLITIGLLALIMNATNPTQEEYVKWLNGQATNETSGVAKGLLTVFGGWAIGSSTTQRDYTFFSVFETELQEDRFKTIGVFDTFIVLP